MGWLSRTVPLVAGTINKSWIKVCLVYSNKLYLLWKDGGLVYVSAYIKTASIVLQQAVGGQRVLDLGPFGARVSRTKCGLPRIIPRLHRVRIRNGDLRVVRAWMTLFGLYRIIEIPFKLKLNTITDPGSPLSGDLVSSFSTFVGKRFVPLLQENFSGAFIDAVADPLEFMKTLRAKPFLINKSSPTRSSAMDQSDERATPLSTSMGSIQGAAYAWRSSSLYPMLEAWCKFTGSIWILNRIESWAPDRDAPSGVIPLGKLGLKFEPAGKVRVFAMVDCFTQWLMRPLHRAIFALLEQIPQDGTFDQLRPMRSMMALREGNPRGMWSYDLSAATDRLPIVIQKVLLSPFLTGWGAEVWGSLLVGRAYYFPGIRKDNKKGLPETEASDLYYARGQPMGALSSWAMLAFTHHAIVQWAAARSIYKDKQEWFTDYAVLGDDIVIGHAEVAREYRAVLDELGVPISAHKSLVAARRPVCEFAKRFFIGTKDASGVPWPEALLAPRVFAVLMDLTRHYKPKLGVLFHFLGYGYRVRGSLTKPFFKVGSRVRNVLLSLYAPGGPLGVPIQDFFRLRSVGTFYRGSDKWSRVIEDYLGALIVRFKQSLDSLDGLRDKVKSLVTVYRDREHYGTLAFKGEKILVDTLVSPETDRLEQVYRAEGREAFQSVSRTSIDPRIAESIRETVYREAFLDVVIELRDVCMELESVEEDRKSDPSSSMERFVSLWERLTDLQDSLESLPLPRSLEMRRADAVMRSRLLSLVRKWYSFSKPFRSTT